MRGVKTALGQIKRRLSTKVAAALTVILQRKQPPFSERLYSSGGVQECTGNVIESFVRVRGRSLPLNCFSFHGVKSAAQPLADTDAESKCLAAASLKIKRLTDALTFI